MAGGSLARTAAFAGRWLVAPPPQCQTEQMWLVGSLSRPHSDAH